MALRARLAAGVPLSDGAFRSGPVVGRGPSPIEGMRARLNAWWIRSRSDGRRRRRAGRDRGGDPRTRRLRLRAVRDVHEPCRARARRRARSCSWGRRREPARTRGPPFVGRAGKLLDGLLGGRPRPRPTSSSRTSSRPPARQPRPARRRGRPPLAVAGRQLAVIGPRSGAARPPRAEALRARRRRSARSTGRPRRRPGAVPALPPGRRAAQPALRGAARRRAGAGGAAP